MKKFRRWLDLNLSSLSLYRRFTGGIWYCMRTSLPMGDIWSRQPFGSCQAKCIAIEDWNFIKWYKKAQRYAESISYCLSPTEQDMREYYDAGYSPKSAVIEDLSTLQ